MFKRFKTLTVDVFRTSVDLTLQREVQVDLDTEGTAVSRTKRTRLGVSLGANVSFPSWTKGDNEESSGETEGKKKIDGHEDRSPGGKAEKAVTTGEAERKKIGANAEKPNKTGVAESTMDGHKERDGAPGGKTGEAESTIDGQERDGSPGGKAEKTEETQTSFTFFLVEDSEKPHVAATALLREGPFKVPFKRFLKEIRAKEDPSMEDQSEEVKAVILGNSGKI